MRKPRVLDSDGIYIDRGCNSVEILEPGILLPLHCGLSREQNSYIKDLNNFIKQHLGVDYHLDVDYSNDLS